MAEEYLVLRIASSNLGKVSEISKFLQDMENAYNSLYSFNYIVDVISIENARDGSIPLKRLITEERPFLTNIVDWFKVIETRNVLFHADNLVLSKVTINSPGVWEFIGSLSPLMQIREYLKDRHERRKDKAYRDYQNQIRGDLEIVEKANGIIKQRIEILKSVGYTDIELKPILINLITDPLLRLGHYQDMGIIEAPIDGDQVEESNQKSIN